MKISALLLTLTLMTISIPSFAQDLSPNLKPCDELYSHRGADLFPAVDCYQKLLPQYADLGSQKTIYERSFIALYAVINLQSGTDSEAQAIQKGLDLLGQMAKTLSASADYNYWNASFISAQAAKLDRGALIPRHIIGALKSIQTQLDTATKLDPSIHLWGPDRVTGLMHTAMPSIVGGDKKLAEVKLAEAYAHVPNFSANAIAYAKILKINGKTEQAKTVLTQLLSTPDDALNPYLTEPLRALTLETTTDKAEAQKVLSQL